MTQPANDAGIAIVGPLTASSGNWRLPARLHLSAPLHFGDDGIRSTRLRARVAGRHESGNTHLPFPAAIDPPLLLRGGTLALAPAGAALRGHNMVPNVDPSGAPPYHKQRPPTPHRRPANQTHPWP